MLIWWMKILQIEKLHFWKKKKIVCLNLIELSYVKLIETI